MIKSLFKPPQLSLRWLLLILCLFPTLGAMGLVGYLSYRSSEKTVEDLAHQLLQENSEDVIRDTNDYLRFIRRINHTHIPIIESSIGSLDDFDQIHRDLVQQHQLFPTIASMVLAKPQGGVLISHRVSGTKIEAGHSREDEPTTVDLYTIPESGGSREYSRTIHNVNIRNYPWYRQAVATGKISWSQPFPMSLDPNVLGLNAYAPFYQPDGTLQGVFGVNVSLEQLNRFLTEHSIGQQGQVFILQRDGLLIANSTQTPIYHSSEPMLLRSQPESIMAGEQVSAVDSDHALIRESAQYLQTELGSLANIQSRQRLSARINGQQKYLQVVPYDNPYGFDWLVVSVVPQSEFLATLHNNRDRTFIIGGFTILTIGALTMVIVDRLAKALQRLNQASQVMAEGNWQHLIQEDSLIQELNLLAGFYNQTGREIQNAHERFAATLQELKATNQRLEQFLEAIPVGIGILDANGQPYYTNQRAMEFLGQGTTPISRLAEISEVYQLYVAGSNQLYPYEQLSLIRALKGESASNTDVEIHLRDRAVPIHTWATPIYNQAGEVEYALVAFQDVTEEKRAERQLWELSERLELSLAAGQIGSWEWDFGSKTVTWDQRMCEIYAVDYPIETDQIPQIWYARIHPEDRDRVYQCSQDSITQQTSLNTEFRIIHPDQSIHFIKSYGLIRQDGQGNSEKMIGVNFDITELKATQLELEATNAELVQANRLKDEFLATMNHELRTPLNAILGMTTALQQQTLGALTHRQQKTLEIIQYSGTHLLDIVNDILDLSKIESGVKKLRCTPTSVLDLCQSAISLIQPQAREKKLTVETKLPSLLLNILVEERLLRQVLINLLSNAVKFTPEGGKVTLEVQFPPMQGENWISFMIQDTGIGIAQEDLDKIFQPFVQIDGALNRQYQGTGIGLSLVKRIVERHEGKVKVSSEKGKGSCFWVELPCVIARERDTCETPAITRENQAELAPTVLLIEPDAAELMTMSNYLEAKGYRVQLAQTLEQALATLKAQVPDLAVFTWEGSEEKGLEAMQTIKQYQSQSLPIIAIAPQSLSAPYQWQIETAHCLSKPIKLQSLAITIQDTLTGKSART